MVLKIFRLYQSNSLEFDTKLAELQAPITLIGYFQDSIYLDLCKDTNLKLLEVRAPSEWYRKFVPYISNDNSLVVHIRRGDYKNLSQTFGLLSREYYLNAIKIISARMDIASIFVFSDSYEDAQSMNFETEFGGARIEYIKPAPNSSDVETLKLMSLSKAIVLSNSTFAWWSATIGNHEYVVMPEKWFRNGDYPSGLSNQKWIKAPAFWEN